jgi:hypothetical protein
MSLQFGKYSLSVVYFLAGIGEQKKSLVKKNIPVIVVEKWWTNKFWWTMGGQNKKGFQPKKLKPLILLARLTGFEPVAYGLEDSEP